MVRSARIAAWAGLADENARFLLSVNDVPETREFFGRFLLGPISTRYTIAGGEWAEAKEIIVMGPSRDDAALVLGPRDLLNLG
jgi:DNA adenine methylase